MNIWIFNHYAQGPTLPGGTRHYDLSKELMKQGHNITIFAAGFHYTLLKEQVDYKNRDHKIEDINGIKFIWVKTYPYIRNNWKRMINIISYAIKLNFLIPKLNLDKPDMIIGSTVHPFAALIASKFAQKYDIPFIFEIRDLWPQTFIDMHLWKPNSLISRFFAFIEKTTVKRSSKIIVLSPLTIDYLQKKYAYPEKNILLLPNGINQNFIQNAGQDFKEYINITYVGGIDKVHGLEFLVDLAKELQNEKIHFNLYGDGKNRSTLETRVREKRLTNVFFHGSIPKNEVPHVLQKANLLFVSTSNVLYGSENKLYEYMAAAKPIIAATSGEHNNPIKDIFCGVTLDRSNIEKSAHELSKFIKKNKDDFIKIGLNGQKYILEHRTIETLSKKLDDFLTQKAT